MRTDGQACVLMLCADAANGLVCCGADEGDRVKADKGDRVKGIDGIPTGQGEACQWCGENLMVRTEYARLLYHTSLPGFRCTRATLVAALHTPDAIGALR